MPAKRSKTPAHRFTGRPPPAEFLLRLPNWEFALDEEGVDGQDEYTLRPAREQGFLSDETFATAVEGKDAKGRDIVGLLFVEGMRSTGCDTVWIWTDAKGPAVYLYTGRREEDGQFHGLAELLSSGIALPLAMRTRVPLQHTLALARNAVCAVARGCRCPEAEFHTEAARQSWRDALADLHARLSGGVFR